MEMYCFQCQETAKNEACTVRGVCGKEEEVAALQDSLIHLLKGISFYSTRAREKGWKDEELDRFVAEALFSTVTNVNFDKQDFERLIDKALDLRTRARKACQQKCGQMPEDLPHAATWQPGEPKATPETVGLLRTENEDLRSLREILTYGLKGIAAYADHAAILDNAEADVLEFLQEGLAATIDDEKGAEELFELTMKAGEVTVAAMAALDEAHTKTYGHPEPTEVQLEPADRPAILISGHDLKDMEELLQQTAGTGVDVYTHGEMLPANAYPAFKEYDHFQGNYGNAWWQQREEFEKFNGPILLTTNCLIPPKDSYLDRLYTTGLVGYPGAEHIADREPEGSKDFSPLIEQAKECDSPEQLEEGSLMTGFAHNSLSQVADKVVEAVQEGHIKRFVVMAGCDGRHRDREYYTKVAQNLPEDAVILTAGCAKYRYNKLDLGDIGGIPRVIDAGQCNDSYSLVVIAQKLAEVFEVDDINELPISFDIAWYEQKAVAVLLALLHLGVKGIRLGPTLPAFVSPAILDVLVDKFEIKPIGTVEEDVEAMMQGK